MSSTLNTNCEEEIKICTTPRHIPVPYIVFDKFERFPFYIATKSSLTTLWASIENYIENHDTSMINLDEVMPTAVPNPNNQSINENDELSFKYVS